jgi:malate dehydrogenase
VGGYYVGAPVILGANGVEPIIELGLTDEERSDFQKSVAAVQLLVRVMGEMSPAK